MSAFLNRRNPSRFVRRSADRHERSDPGFQHGSAPTPRPAVSPISVCEDTVSSCMPHTQNFGHPPQGALFDASGFKASPFDASPISPISPSMPPRSPQSPCRCLPDLLDLPVDASLISPISLSMPPRSPRSRCEVRRSLPARHPQVRRIERDVDTRFASRRYCHIEIARKP